jgi:hypothetical protein
MRPAPPKAGAGVLHYIHAHERSQTVHLESFGHIFHSVQLLQLVATEGENLATFTPLESALER